MVGEVGRPAVRTVLPFLVANDDDDEHRSAVGENPMNRLLLPERLLGSGINPTTSGSLTASVAISTVVRCLSYMWVTASLGRCGSVTSAVYYKRMTSALFSCGY